MEEAATPLSGLVATMKLLAGRTVCSSPGHIAAIYALGEIAHEVHGDEDESSDEAGCRALGVPAEVGFLARFRTLASGQNWTFVTAVQYSSSWGTKCSNRNPYEPCPGG